MRPLRIKASAYPVSSSNIQGLQEMTDAEIEQYYSAILTKEFADNADGTGTAEINVNGGSGTSIGAVTDTKRDDAVGTHPTDGASSNVTTYTAKQIESAASESITNRPIGYESSGTVGIHEFTDSELDSDILDKVLDDMVAGGDYTIGQYSLAASSPSGGTWTQRYTLADTQVDGTTNNMYIWQKTTATSSAVDNYKPLKVKDSGAGVQEMTVAEMEQVVPNMRNLMISSGKGKYVLQTAAPGSGTWVQMGDSGGFTDTKKDVSAQNYTGGYSGSYTGSYTGGYTGAKNYAGTYTGTSGYSGSYTGAKNYSGTYTGTSGYSGAYSGAYAGNYAADYNGYAGTSYQGFYTGSYTGYYTGAKNYTGTYTGTSAYAGTYTGPKNYSGTYTGTSAYSGTYSGTYTGYYSGTYSGDTIQSSSSTVSTVKLWLRTA